LSLVLMGTALFGCEPGDRTAIYKESEVAANHAGKAADLALGSFERYLDRVNADSKEGDIKAAQKQAIASRNKLKTSPGVHGDDLASLETEIERLGAALDLKRLQAQSDQVIQGARQAGETLQDAQKRLEQSSADFKDLQIRAQKALQRYDALAAQISGDKPAAHSTDQ